MLVCTKCREVGHLAAQCPKAAPPCTTCHKHGHIAKECAENGKKKANLFILN